MAVQGEIIEADPPRRLVTSWSFGWSPELAAERSRVTWDIERGRVSLVRFGEGQAVVVIRTQGLIIPALGRNPSPDLLARLVCHDAAGAPSEAARTRAVPFPEDGDATLIDVVAVPGDCYAPIVLLTGSRDPDGNQPGNWFAVSGF